MVRSERIFGDAAPRACATSLPNALSTCNKISYLASSKSIPPLGTIKINALSGRRIPALERIPC